jgi:hypothetical protein
VKFGYLQTRYIGGWIGVGHRMAKPLFLRDGNRNAVFSTLAGRVIARRSFSIFWPLPPRPIRLLVATRHGPELTNGKICTAAIFSMQAPSSSISFLTHGSISEVFKIGLCAKRVVTISKIAVGLPTFSVNTHHAIHMSFATTVKTAGDSPLATAREREPFALHSLPLLAAGDRQRRYMLTDHSSSEL